jgi:hypothetical protein
MARRNKKNQTAAVADLSLMMERLHFQTQDIVPNWRSPSKFFWARPVTAIVENNYLFMHILAYWDYSQDVATLVHGLCKSKRVLSIEEEGSHEAPQIIRKMCVHKKITEIFVSETFEAREKEWALTEAALM